MKNNFVFISVSFLIAFIFNNCGFFPRSEGPPPEKIPFDPNKQCTQEFDVPLDKSYFTNGDCVVAQCPDGNFILAGGAYVNYPELPKDDTINQTTSQLDCYAEKISRDGTILWKKYFVLSAGDQDLIENIQACKSGYIASANCSHYITDNYGSKSYMNDKVIILFDENGTELRRAWCDSMNTNKHEKILEQEDGSFFVYGDQKGHEVYDVKTAFLMNLNKDGKIISKNTLDYGLEYLRYEKCPDFSYYKIETGESWDEDGRRRNIKKAVNVVKYSKDGKQIWHSGFEEPTGYENIVPSSEDYNVAADPSGVFVLWQDWDISNEKKDSNGVTFEKYTINLTRVEENENKCRTKRFEMDNYSEPYSILKTSKGWRMAGMSGVKTRSGGGGPTFCSTASIGFEGPKKFFIAEFNDEGKITEVKSFYNGDEIKSAILTENGIIFLTEGHLIKSKF